MIQVMLDLETMGVRPNAAFAAIGAVKFDPATGEIHDGGFYCLVDLDSAVEIGLELDVSTFLWWLEQSDDARMSLLTGTRLPIREALSGFLRWYGNAPMPTWGNGPASDNVWIKEALRHAGLRCPWTHKEDRCYRTIREMRPYMEVEPYGTYHNPLDDAICQAKHLLKVLETMPKDHGLH